MIGHGGSDVVVDGAKNRVLHVRVMTADGDIMSHSKESRTNTHGENTERKESNNAHLRP